MEKTPDIVKLLELTVQRGASDLVLTVGVPPMLKVDGEFHPTEFEPLTPQDTRRLMYAMMDEKQQRQFEENKELDFSFSLPGKGWFRVNVFFQRGSVGGVLRAIPAVIKGFDELGLPKNIAEIALSPRGLVLVTGPTGSGKSTTLAAMVDYINENRRVHIVTIEDPIEFFHKHKMAIVNQREVGTDTHDFSRALRSVLRQAPDVILVGEMRDYETIRAAITAAETGHLVMGTLHTNSAPETIDRIVDVFPEEQQEQVRVQLANNLVAVLTQQLLPKAHGDGRVLAYELMIATPAVRALIREGKTHQLPSVIQTGGQYGMITMDAHLADLYRRKLITYEVGLARAVDPKEFSRLAGMQEPSPSSARRRPGFSG
ncbi:type IV pilus twitching motility protein PilT [Marinithermus hydrothermalis]|uniref:Twitching motility protein n=1 Tax=Marinithermus hydrothermalis (strain DSM 14884 / JCM 11576 / T1) TaxID=869210 RepID=F2NPR0_MARHT|nr:type IV pilus twitching motility protein PilT [Marinithermus hydrothermalis]AEB12836.1 twitching motility protein [Marinithermus hydrothermalis DSM 14884]